MQHGQVVVRALHRADDEPQLVERVPCPDLDREGPGNHLEEEPTAIARRDLVEVLAVVGHHAGEDVESTGRASRVGAATQPGGEGKLLDQGDQVGSVLLQDRALAQIDLLHGVFGQSVIDAVQPRQEAAPKAIRPLAEVKVQTCGLDVALRDAQSLRADISMCKDLLERL